MPATGGKVSVNLQYKEADQEQRAMLVPLEARVTKPEWFALVVGWGQLTYANDKTSTHRGMLPAKRALTPQHSLGFSPANIKSSPANTFVKIEEHQQVNGGEIYLLRVIPNCKRSRAIAVPDHVSTAFRNLATAVQSWGNMSAREAKEAATIGMIAPEVAKDWNEPIAEKQQIVDRSTKPNGVFTITIDPSKMKDADITRMIRIAKKEGANIIVA